MSTPSPSNLNFASQEQLSALITQIELRAPGTSITSADLLAVLKIIQELQLLLNNQPVQPIHHETEELVLREQALSYVLGNELLSEELLYEIIKQRNLSRFLNIYIELIQHNSEFSLNPSSEQWNTAVMNLEILSLYLLPYVKRSSELSTLFQVVLAAYLGSDVMAFNYLRSNNCKFDKRVI